MGRSENWNTCRKCVVRVYNTLYEIRVESSHKKYHTYHCHHHHPSRHLPHLKKSMSRNLESCYSDSCYFLFVRNNERHTRGNCRTHSHTKTKSHNFSPKQEGSKAGVVFVSCPVWIRVLYSGFISTMMIPKQNKYNYGFLFRLKVDLSVPSSSMNFRFCFLRVYFPRKKGIHVGMQSKQMSEKKEMLSK